MAHTRSKTSSITIRFAGDSGDGMQLTGEQFTHSSALMGNDIATFPDFPAEIRAPIGTLPGVSSFQIQFSENAVFTAGDLADVLVAMNPAALKVNLGNIKKGGTIIVNEDVFTEANLIKAAFAENPLVGETLKDFQLIKVPLTTLTKNALAELQLKPTETERCKNFFALGMTFWMYDRKMEPTLNWIHQKFAKRPEIAKANEMAVKAGYNYADITETFVAQVEIPSAPIEPGIYRKITGNQSLAIGLITGSNLADKTLMYGSYPITPASDILHELAKRKNYGVKTFQAEDEIAAIGFAVGASFAGQIGITGTSGPGICLKSEMMGLAIVSELPLVIINVQRGGPSTGLPTKTEQSDLLQALYGRNGESPLCVIAPKTPADCFEMGVEAIRIAIKFMTPVIVLSDGNIANGSEPWKLPDVETLEKISVAHPEARDNGEPFLPFERDDKTFARPWGIPGVKGLEHRNGGLAKANITGNVSYDPHNNQLMNDIRRDKIARIADFIPEAKVEWEESGDLLILGWGSPYGSIFEALAQLKHEGITGIGHLNLNYINPFPKNVGEILSRFKRVLVPELNFGQLLMLLRMRFPGTEFIGYHKLQGQPFKVFELKEKIREVLGQ